MVPEGWERPSVGDIFQVQLGKMLNQVAKEGAEQRDYLTNINVRWGQFDLSNLNRMHFSASEREKFRLKAGDLIVCEGGEVGRCAIWKDDIDECYYQKALHRLRPTNDAVLPDFAYMFFEHGNANGLFLHYSTRSSIAHLTREKLMQVPILLPPLPEQRKIAEILSTWDRAIETSEALLATARTQKRALMQTLLTGKRRFPEFEGQDWREVRLGEVADIRIGGTPARKEPSYWQGGSNTWLSIADLGPKYVGQSKEMITEDGVARSNVKLLPENTVVMSFKLTIGKLGITRKPLYTNEAICGFVPKSADKFDPEFLFQLLHVSDLLADVDQAVKGKTLNKAKLNELRLSLPAIAEQRRIAAFLLIADEEIGNAEAQIKKLRTEKKALMQQLLTGKRRVVVN